MLATRGSCRSPRCRMVAAQRLRVQRQRQLLGAERRVPADRVVLDHARRAGHGAVDAHPTERRGPRRGQRRPVSPVPTGCSTPRRSARPHSRTPAASARAPASPLRSTRAGRRRSWRCPTCSPPTAPSACPPPSIDLTAACDVLAAWDGVYDLDRAGPMIWRETMGRFDAAAFENAGAAVRRPVRPGDAPR